MPRTESKDFWKLFKPSACILDLSGADCDAIFDEVLDVLVRSKALPDPARDGAKRALHAREKMASTGVGRHVAVPHVQIGGIDEVVVSLALHPAGVEWHALDGEPAQVFFTVLRPERAGSRYDPARHLEMMRWIAGLGRDEDFVRFALGVKTRSELVDLLREKSPA